jgi:hypothetical protein
MTFRKQLPKQFAGYGLLFGLKIKAVEIAGDYTRSDRLALAGHSRYTTAN